MILQGNCKKCHTEIKLDIGDKTVEEVVFQLEQRKSFECPGHHVELGSPYPHYWKVEEWDQVEGTAPTEEEWLEELRSRCVEVLSTDEMRSRDIITSFCYGLPMTSDGHNWDFTQSPSGKRYYYRRD